MKVYRFYCDTCWERFEALVPMGESPRSASCSMCGGATSKRLARSRSRGGVSASVGEVATAFEGGCCGGEYGCGARAAPTPGAGLR